MLQEAAAEPTTFSAAPVLPSAFYDPQQVTSAEALQICRHFRKNFE